MLSMPSISTRSSILSPMTTTPASPVFMRKAKAGKPIFSPQPDKGQLRLWSYQAVAHGAMGINYFRWDTATFGAEQYWHGLLNHDRSHSPAFDEAQRTIAELKSLGSDLLQSAYEAQAALCFDY